MLRTKAISQSKKLPLSTRLSIVLLFFMVNILITELVFKHEHNVKFPPVIETSPCEMPEDLLDKFDFISTKHEYADNFSGINATSCKYYREGFTVNNQLARDEVILTRMRVPHTVPANFNYANPHNPESYVDRIIQNNREIHEICVSNTQCLAYIEPNILLRFIYHTGATCQQDALRFARTYAIAHTQQDQSDISI